MSATPPNKGTNKHVDCPICAMKIRTDNMGIHIVNNHKVDVLNTNTYSDLQALVLKKTPYLIFQKKVVYIDPKTLERNVYEKVKSFVVCLHCKKGCFEFSRNCGIDYFIKSHGEKCKCEFSLYKNYLKNFKVEEKEEELDEEEEPEQKQSEPEQKQSEPEPKQAEPKQAEPKQAEPEQQQAEPEQNKVVQMSLPKVLLDYLNKIESERKEEDGEYYEEDTLEEQIERLVNQHEKRGKDIDKLAKEKLDLKNKLSKINYEHNKELSQIEDSYNKLLSDYTDLKYRFGVL